MGNVRGIILAGGQGKRFRPLTYYFQKCMIPVGEEQKPVLEYIIRLFTHHNIKDLVVLVGYKNQQVKNYFNNGSRFGANIKYVLDDPEYKGNAGAIVNAYRKGDILDDDVLIIYYADILSDFDLKEMLSEHVESEASATVALAKGYNVRVGTAEIQGGLISKFIEKPELEQPVSVGISILNGALLGEMQHLFETEKKGALDLMGEFIPHLIEHQHPIKAYVSDAFWYDLGSLERYEHFENEGLSKRMSFLNSGN